MARVKLPRNLAAVAAHKRRAGSHRNKKYEAKQNEPVELDMVDTGLMVDVRELDNDQPELP